jgi:hypothetical protein
MPSRPKPPDLAKDAESARDSPSNRHQAMDACRAQTGLSKC